MMQFTSLTPGPTRTLADIDTFGPICVKNKQVSALKNEVLTLDYLPVTPKSWYKYFEKKLKLNESGQR